MYEHDTMLEEGRKYRLPSDQVMEAVRMPDDNPQYVWGLKPVEGSNSGRWLYVDEDGAIFEMPYTEDGIGRFPEKGATRLAITASDLQPLDEWE